MSLKKIDQVKNQDRGFKPLDIVVYAVIILAVAALFVVFFFTRDTSALAGFTVYYNNDEVMTYDFGDGSYDIIDGSHIAVEDESDESITFRFFVNEERRNKDYNIIMVDKTAVSVTVSDADCSSRKDCYYMDDIVDMSSAIMCTPHKMKIIPYGYEAGDDGTIPVG